MFYFSNWELFCQRITKEGYVLCTTEQSLHCDVNARFIVLKHDVETNIKKAYKLASIEHKYGICGSYYVQAYLLKESDNIVLLREMQSWGHEISYHYDVLDANSGDMVAAERDFSDNLRLFHSYGFYFSTICQHGNPVKNRTGYSSNRDFFRSEDVRNHYPNLVDVVVNYSKHSMHKYQYISDAGYRWSIICEPETNDLNQNSMTIRIGSFNRLIDLIHQSKDLSFIISTHPHRWMSSPLLSRLKIITFHIVRSSVIAARHIPGIDIILNKFYYWAKKI